MAPIPRTPRRSGSPSDQHHAERHTRPPTRPLVSTMPMHGSTSSASWTTPPAAAAIPGAPAAPPALHLHAFARKHPTLAVVGLLQPDAGLLPLAHWQSVAVARWLRLRREDPAAAAVVQQKEAGRPLRSWSRRHVVPTRRHWFEVDHVDYLRAVDGLLREMEP